MSKDITSDVIIESDDDSTSCATKVRKNSNYIVSLTHQQDMVNEGIGFVLYDAILTVSEMQYKVILK